MFFIFKFISNIRLIPPPDVLPSGSVFLSVLLPHP